MTKTQFARRLVAWRGVASQPLAAKALQRPLKTYQNWEQARSMPGGQALTIVLDYMETHSVQTCVLPTEPIKS